MKKKASHTKVIVFSEDCIFHVVVFYWFILHFSHNFLNWTSDLKLNMAYNMIKIQFFLHQPLFLFFECFEHMDPFLWNILKFTKKLKRFGKHLIKEKDIWYKKTTCPHFFLNALNI
jgi:hypothetical protein